MTTSSFESGIFDPLTSGEGQRSRHRPDERSRPPNADAQERRDAILNAYFDHDKSVSRERLRSTMRADPRLAVDFERTEAVLSEMNLRERPVAVPDLSEAVLARVDELQPYVAAPVRRQVSSARIAAVGAVLSGITLVVVLNQVQLRVPAARMVDDEPRIVSAVPTPRTVSAVANAAKPVARTAGLDDASKFLSDRWDMGQGDLPTAALDHRAALAVRGGHDSGPGVYSASLSRNPEAVGTRSESLQWTSFLGYPVLVPRAMMIPEPARAGKVGDSAADAPTPPR